MPTLDNARHEAFAQCLAKGMTATEAYIKAGYKPNDGNAATLKGNQRMRDRLAELLAKAAERTIVTVEDIAKQLDVSLITVKRYMKQAFLHCMMMVE